MRLRCLQPERITQVKVVGKLYAEVSSGIWEVPDPVGYVLLQSSEWSAQTGKGRTFERIEPGTDIESLQKKQDSQAFSELESNNSEPFGKL